MEENSREENEYASCKTQVSLVDVNFGRWYVQFLHLISGYFSIVFSLQTSETDIFIY